jgi:integrase/recombinase XerD
VAKDLETYYLQDRCSGQVKRVKDEAAFMLNKGGYRMKGGQYNQLLKELTAKAGLPDEVSLHHLRHSIATHLLQSGMSMEKVRDFLGHYTLETTQLYAKPDITQLTLL